MPVAPKKTTANIIPCLRYRDAPTAIDWLCDAFGFQKHLVVPGDNNTIAHAQLTFGNGMIMLGSTEVENAYGKLIAQPDDVGKPTQSINVVVSDADAVYASALKAGAQIVIDIEDQHYGGRAFTCRDVENHIWNFGTYDPFA